MLDYYYPDDFFGDFFSDPDIATGIAAIFGILVIIFLFFTVFSLVLYIFRAIALYRLAANRGMSNPGLAWIPFIGIFRAGAIADSINGQNGSKTYFGFLILGGTLISWVLSGVTNTISLSSAFGEDSYRYGDRVMGSALMNQPISSLGALVGIATFVITIISLNRVYKTYNPLNSTAWTVLSVIFPFLQPFFLFSVRNRVPTADWNPQHGYYPPSAPPYPPQDGGYYPPQQPAPPYPPQNGGYYPQQAPPTFMQPDNHYQPDLYHPPKAPEQIDDSGNGTQDKK